jgi:predicted nucleic acid-binding protein
MLYFDASYLVRMHTRDPGWEKVRTLAATDHLACCLHGQAETVAAFHRKFREGTISHSEFNQIVSEFQRDSAQGAFEWLLLSPAVAARLVAVYGTLSTTVPLRAADGLHLACAAEHGFKQVYSNDARLLAAAGHFGLKGMNIF